MKPYEIIEHTADIGLRANGKTLKELFENAARGMFEIVGSKDLVKGKGLKVTREIRIKKEIEAFEELLVDWLGELLYIFNKEGIFFKDFNILKLNNHSLFSKSSGNKVNLTNTTLQTEIKAVTFHNLRIEEDINGFNCTVIFDV